MRFLSSVLLLVLLISLSSLAVSAHESSSSSSLFFYISFHGGKSGINDIYKYDLSGNLVLSGILKGGSMSNMRSMAFGPGQNTSALFVANAKDSDSRVALFGPCSPKGHRDYVGDFATSQLQHPYGVAWGSMAGSNALFVSNQNINTVDAFDASGNFVSTLANIDPDQVRGVTYSGLSSSSPLLYYANKDANTLAAIDLNSGKVNPEASFSVEDPISSTIDPVHKQIYISSGSGNSVLQFDIPSGSLVRNLTDPTLQHPTGSVLLQGKLYVVNQGGNNLLAFDLSSGQSLGPVIQSFPDTAEQILLSPC